MEQVRIFYDEPEIVEKAINRWLKKNQGKIIITRTMQSANDDYLTIITIFYKMA